MTKKGIKVGTPASKRGASAPPREKTLLAKLDKTLKKIPKGTFANVGGALGSKFGPIAGGLGRMAGAGLSAITGYGNYTVSSNTLSTVSTSVDMVPQFVKNEHSIRVKHREFIKDLVVPDDPSAFSLTDYLINPGNRDLFPWLAQMAPQYSQYKIHGMVFAYKSMTSDYAANGPLGTVFMATNYNAVDRAFSSKLELENTEFAVSTKPSLSLLHAIECDPKVSGFDILYIRDPSYETSDISDRRFYDYGRFQVGTQGLPGNTGATLGELWVTYDIELIKPIIGGLNVKGYSLVSKPDGSLGVGLDARFCSARVTMPSINLAATTSYNVIPTNAGTLSGDTTLWGKVFNTSSTGFVKLLKNGTHRITIWATCDVVGTARLMNSDTATPVTPVIALGGRAWYNAVAKDVAPSPYTNFGNGKFMAPRVPCEVAATGLTPYVWQGIFRVYGIEDDGTNDYVTITIPSFTTGSAGVGFVSNYVRVLEDEWSEFGENYQLKNFIPEAPYT